MRMIGALGRGAPSGAVLSETGRSALFRGSSATDDASALAAPALTGGAWFDWLA